MILVQDLFFHASEQILYIPHALIAPASGYLVGVLFG